MGWLSFFRRPDINQGVEDYRNTAGALLLDVRTPREYREGHIWGSINVPLQSIDNIAYVTGNKDKMLYVYCHSGVRSAEATDILRDMGFTNVRNIGGIVTYSGKVES